MVKRSCLRGASCVLGVLTLGLVLVGLTVGQAWSATVIRLGHVAFPGSLIAVTADEYAKRVNEALKGKVEVKVFHSSQLGTDSEMLKGIKVGVLEMFVPSTIMSTVDPGYGVFEMPYLFKDRPHVKRVAEDPKVKAALFEPLPEKGLRILGMWENGFRQITNNVRPVVTPDDLKGIKLRVPKGVWRVKMFRAYGANPTPLAYAEVFAALQSGVMDGQENPLPQISGGKFHEVQKYLSLSDHVYTPAYGVISERFWKTLPADVQQVLAKTALEVGDFARQEGARMDKELLEKMKASLKVNDVDKDSFVKASKSVYEEFTKEVAGGKDLVDRIMALR
ncbi:MAG TPA: TRAP transporter substrate-binding protein [Candidatus Methylomirabilis sp.]|nr:TRAP transporter substrate-binding protein [Candidatus Methylomirabilis sp.]HSD50487.1 TRAP transporter substrate-binding protein [Candidatus Methylomirabilis sp.]